ncbi:MAG: DMT family transporter [Campylobacterales bacterium]|nr:DMT family transporter [Campylobacterales bacterium]
MKKEREGEWLVVGLSFFESWFPILSIVSISHIGALYTYTYASVVALAFFLLVMYKRGLYSELKNPLAYKDLLLTSFWITLLFALVFVGMGYTTAGNMSVILFMQLLFSYLYFNLLGKEKMNMIHSMGALLMGSGALVILVPNDLRFNKGDILILVAAAIAPIANLYAKRARNFCSSETIVGFRTLAALPFIAGMAWWLEPAVTPSSFYKALPYVILVGLFVFGISKIMWMEALYRISITKMSAMTALVPVMTLCFAYLYLGEVPKFRQIVGILPVLIGGYLLTRPLKQEG